MQIPEHKEVGTAEVRQEKRQEACEEVVVRANEYRNPDFGRGPLPI